MTLNFYVSYLVPVNPEKIQEIEQEIARAEAELANLATTGSPLECKEMELRLTRLRAQIKPERRREAGIMRPYVGPNEHAATVWYCPKCYGEKSAQTLGIVCNGMVTEAGRSCPGCGAEVHKEELPMSLDLFRLRTRRTDGVEVQSKPQA